jgi:glycosyltransferase involved in cell wall biosynthesis
VMTAAPLVSVVIPTHDRPSMLALTLQCVLWQAGVDLEVVVVDDGSSLDVRRVVDATGDARVRLLRHERPLGVSAARNRGSAEARGMWIAFLDDDDLWAPDKLTAQIQEAESQRSRWAYVGAVNVTEDLQVLGGGPPRRPDYVARFLPRANLIPGGCSGVAVRSDLLPEEPFDGSYRHFADWDLWIRLAKLDLPASVSRPLVGYRVHGGNASLDTAGMVAELDVIDRRYDGPVDRVRFLRHVARVSQRAGRRKDAMGFYVRAARRDPEYRRRGFLSDLAEIAAGVRLDARRRLLGPTTETTKRHAGQSTWAAEAVPWLDDIRRLWFGRRDISS